MVIPKVILLEHKFIYFFLEKPHAEGVAAAHYGERDGPVYKENQARKPNIPANLGKPSENPKKIH